MGRALFTPNRLQASTQRLGLIIQRGMLALVLLGGFALVLAQAQGADPMTADVRVMSFNVRYGTANDGPNHWERRREFLVDTIRAFDPDLLGTQETLGFQRDYLAQQLPGYDVLGVGRNDGKEDGEMMALYYRKGRFELIDSGHFWLSETPEVVGSKSWDSSLPRMVTWVKLIDTRSPASPPIAFFNTHFDHQGGQARLESARLLRQKVEALGQGCSIIVTGDFNTAEGSPPYQALFGSVEGTKSPLRDTFRIVHPTPGPDEGTFSGFRAEGTKGSRIDWIGVSHDWDVVSAAIDRTAREGRTPSDHFPVTAVVRRADPEPPAPDSSAQRRAAGEYEVETVLNVPYYEGADADPHKHQLDLFLPKGKRDFPVLFFIHGGAWTIGDRKWFGMVGQTFARQGIGTVVISYRLSPRVRHPAHIQDVARAFAWTHRNIARYGGRADQIFVSGQSAGGHLAALLATNEKYLQAEGLSAKDIKGVMPISGIYVFRPGFAGAVLGPGADAAESASPLNHVDGSEPPFLILYADGDFPGCDKMSRDLGEALRKHGVPAEVREIIGRNHLSIMFRMMLSAEDATSQELLKFIACHSGTASS